jgi:hypothetical protein
LEQTTKAQEEELAIKQSQLQHIEDKITGYNNKLLINKKIPALEQTISEQEDELAFGQSQLQRVENKVMKYKKLMKEQYEMDSLERLEEQKRKALDFSNTYLLDRQRSALNSLDVDIKLAKIELEIKEKQERNRKQILTADYTKTRINRELREMDPPVVLKRSTTRKEKLQTPRDALLSAFAKKARQKKAKALADKYLYGNLAQFEKEEAEEERDEAILARSDIIRRAGAYAVENNITYAEALRMLS